MSDVDWQLLAKHIRNWSKQLGFAEVGFVNSEKSEHQSYLNEWLAKGYHGDMAYMAKHGHLRSEPASLHPGTRSIICLRLDYFQRSTEPDRVLASDSKAYLSRYALGRDYHKVIRGKLKQLSRKISDHLIEQGYEGFDARVFTDSAPLLEKAFAERAGLGWIGKNTLLLNEHAGSWFFLGEILTNLPLPPSEKAKTNRCGSCSACMEACPTKAFTGPYQLDARKCISYLTIEHKGSIDEPLRELMGNRIFGCDDCQLVCPWTRYSPESSEPDFSPRHNLDSSTLLDLFQWTEDEFLTKTEGSAIRRAGYLGWVRNIAIALGNGPSSERVLRVLESRLGLSALTDEHIKWAITRLS
jgi:epoxyqueuosine reductase